MLSNVIAQLTAFPYLNNYLQLAAIEREALAISGDSRLAFIGGGPMPLTAIALAMMEIAHHQGVLAQFQALFHSAAPKNAAEQLEHWLTRLEPDNFNSKFHIDSFDILPEAVDASKKLIEHLGLSHVISSRLGDGSELTLEAETCTVMIASMAEPKESILRNIAHQGFSREGLNILVRSVEEHNLRRLLYEPVDENILSRILTEIPGAVCSKRFSPPAGSLLINSFVILSIPSKRQEQNIMEHL